MPKEPFHTSSQARDYACLIITFAAATISVIGRLIARRLTKVSFWFDDYLAISAYICAAAWSGLVIWWLQSGLGLFLRDINMPVEQTLERTRLILWNAELFYAFSLAFSKLAILGFYWRMFKTSHIRTPIQILAACAVVWLFLRTFLAIFHCIPVAKFWRPSLRGHCAIDDPKFLIGTVITHLAIDVVILALPIIEVRRLKLPLTQRLGIMAMFGFGIFVCVASIMVVLLSVQLETASIELPTNVEPIILWATVEVNLAIVSACLPMLRPIYLLLVGRLLTKDASHSTSYGQSRSVPTTHKLATLNIHRDSAKSESESTHHFVTREGSVSSSLSEFRGGEHGNSTVITGIKSRDGTTVDDNIGRGRGMTIGSSRRGSRSEGDGWASMGGIYVTNETSVRHDRVVTEETSR